MRNTHLEQMFSALHRKADSSQTSRHDRFVPIALKESFLGDERKILGPPMRFALQDVKDPLRFIQNKPGTFVAALQGAAAAKGVLEINFRENFGVAGFSTFATVSAQMRSADRGSEFVR
jgi:hypothetical protein